MGIGGHDPLTGLSQCFLTGVYGLTTGIGHIRQGETMSTGFRTLWPRKWSDYDPQVGS